MEAKAKLTKVRDRIDNIDARIIELFQERMSLGLEAGELKTQNNLALVDESREQNVVDRAVKAVDTRLAGEAALFMRSIIALSREFQRQTILRSTSPLLPPAKEPKRGAVTCAYQGVPGAWSEEAALSVFPEGQKKDVESFEDVFLAVKNGEADYGVVPIENSRTGAIGETYDLLRKYGCFIVGKTVVRSRHCLLAPKGVKLEDIREVTSHPEALRQCHGFIHGRAWDLIAARNTAMGAEAASKSTSGRLAAIGSRRAAEIYGLNILKEDIMDDQENQTSFVVIAQAPEYDQTSNIVSITFATQHRAGALCEALLAFMAMGINLMRIESRPSTMGNYRFFVDLEGNIDGQAMKLALRQASSVCQYLEVTGCYKMIDRA